MNVYCNREKQIGDEELKAALQDKDTVTPAGM